MGLRDRIRSKLKSAKDRFSGEYSREAPEAIEPYERDLGEDRDREVVMAKLNRPRKRG